MSENYEFDDIDISKKVRPYTLISVLLLFFLFAILDALNLLKITDKYIEIIGDICYMVIGFYFSSRGVEKIFRIIKKK
ncbi:MAG: hypothetical protein ACK4EX_02480 [Thermaurantimonas sp.]|uniref:Uncharacterized protein n=1 Tax=Thermaurantimonas aggregans TaxID=2173829 RepID=A0A401XI04_9FLAO|nr:hypothetical protein [Thermaurantimonas aggregans]MCX8149208.1 hypothetical protein [Thermaurantimonas aggregans]GCD76650.1 hypothetical protein JCM31826_01320 [Thermaurantimonas aggregans]